MVQPFGACLLSQYAGGAQFSSTKLPAGCQYLYRSTIVLLYSARQLLGLMHSSVDYTPFCRINPIEKTLLSTVNRVFSIESREKVTEIIKS